MVKFIKDHPWLVSLGLIVVFGFAGFWYQEQQAKERRQQICYAELEDRLLLDDIVSFVAKAPTATEDPGTAERNVAIREAFQEFADERINIPPTICKGTGVTTQDVVEDQVRKGLREKG